MSESRKRIFLFVLIALLIIILVIASQRMFVEKYYTSGLYPPVAKGMRALLGWSSLSFGDVLYFLAAVWILYKLIKNIRLLFIKKLSGRIIWRKTKKLLVVLLSIYIIFMVLWGLNYSRKGIAYQLQLPHPSDQINDLLNMQEFVLMKVNESKQDLINSGNSSLSNSEIFQGAVDAYHKSEKKYPFLHYQRPSIKSSLYGSIGNYLGFTGYYNPFTGEAQVNTTVPRFLLPSITTHEMAHQLGYAKENEANFVGFITAANSDDASFRYAAYLDIFLYANSQLRVFDSSVANETLNKLIPPVRRDIETWRTFSITHQGLLEPAVRWLYGNFLRLNNQPQGMRSYNQVISMVIAYYKKEGIIP